MACVCLYSIASSSDFTVHLTVYGVLSHSCWNQISFYLLNNMSLMLENKSL